MFVIVILKCKLIGNLFVVMANLNYCAISNFKFCSSKSRIDWKRLEALDLERIIAEKDIETLTCNFDIITKCDLEIEFLINNCHPLCCKLFRLAQLGIDFLLHCKTFLQQKLIQSDKQLQLLKEEILITNLKKKIGTRISKKKVLSACIVNAPFKCKVCKKIFISESHLKHHETKRHRSEVLSSKTVEIPLNHKLKHSKSIRQFKPLSDSIAVDKESNFKHTPIIKFEELLNGIDGHLNNLKLDSPYTTIIQKDLEDPKTKNKSFYNEQTVDEEFLQITKYGNNNKITEDTLQKFTNSEFEIAEKEYVLTSPAKDITIIIETNSVQELGTSMCKSPSDLKNYHDLNLDLFSPIVIKNNDSSSSDCFLISEKCVTANGSIGSSEAKAITLENKFQEVMEKYFKSPTSNLKIIIDHPEVGIELPDHEENYTRCVYNTNSITEPQNNDVTFCEVLSPNSYCGAKGLNPNNVIDARTSFLESSESISSENKLSIDEDICEKRIFLQNESEFNFKLTSLGISPEWEKIPDSLFKQKKIQLAELREQSTNDREVLFALREQLGTEVNEKLETLYKNIYSDLSFTEVCSLHSGKHK